MRVFITGMAGCLGANCAEHLAAQGAAVLGVDDFATADRDRAPKGEGIELVEGDICDAALVKSLFDRFQPTHVVHSAASYKDPDDWIRDAEVNVIGTIHVIQAAKAAGVKRFVNFQTSLCYGEPRTQPVSADHRLAPFTSYGITKTAGELFLAMSDLPWVSLRTAIVTGPRHFSGPIPIFSKRLSEGKSCFAVDTRRDFLAWEDFVALFDKVMQEDAPSGAFNAGSGRDYSIKEVHDLIAEKLGVTLEKPVDVRAPGDDEVTAFLLDIAETERAFDWSPKIELSEALDKQLALYEAEGFATSYSHIQPAKSD